MSMPAAGAYLWELRKARNLSRADVATTLHTSISQIERIERGDGETRASLLLGFARLVQADLLHLTDLLLATDATTADGQARATQILSAAQQQDIRTSVEGLSQDQLDEILIRLQRLEDQIRTQHTTE
jgi:transcriptional regulator with XRE-family HTH domain